MSMDVETTHEEVAALLEDTAKLSIAYLALRVNELQRTVETLTSKLHDTERRLEGRLDSASKQFKALKDEVKQ